MIELTVRFCTAQQSRQLNAEYRQQGKPTNVLTFTYGIHPQNNCLTADILLCVPVLQDEAHAQQKSIPDHVAHLWVHGILHALGFDHIKEDEAQEMETLEIEIFKDFHIQTLYASFIRLLIHYLVGYATLFITVSVGPCQHIHHYPTRINEAYRF